MLEDEKLALLQKFKNSDCSEFEAEYDGLPVIFSTRFLNKIFSIDFGECTEINKISK